MYLFNMECSVKSKHSPPVGKMGSSNVPAYIRGIAVYNARKPYSILIFMYM